jgi:small subunit ribosomal protein S17
MPRPRHTHLPLPKRLVGTVVSTGMDRTAVVAVSRLYIHPITSKIMRHVSKFFAHDRHEVCGVGDRVHIKFWGPISKKKRWAILDVVHRHPQVEGEGLPMSRLVNPPAAEEVLRLKKLDAERRAKEAEEAAQAAAAGVGGGGVVEAPPAAPAPPPELK